jgi:hypothetical protein
MNRLVTALVATGVLLVLSAAPAAAQTGSLTITNLLCPTEYGGSNFAADCTEPPDPPLGFVLDGPTPMDGTPDASGVVTFSGLEPGTYTVTGGVPGEFADLVVSCVRADADYPVEQDGAIVTIEIPADAEISCFWWNIPLDLSGKEPPTSAMLPPELPVVQVSVTLAGMALLGVAAALAWRRLTRGR